MAALIDGRLDDANRQRAQAHLADCEECHDAFVETLHLAREVAEDRHAVQRPRLWQQPRFFYGAIGAAAAVLVAFVLVRPLLPTDADRLDDAVKALAAATGTSRLTEGRLSGPFEWGPTRSTNRGVSTTVSPELALQARKLQDLAQTLPAAMGMRASGLGLLALGDLNGAIEALQHAARADDIHAEIDLSAALLERWRERGDLNDAKAAKAHAERAMARGARSIEACFNFAVAAEALGLKEEAAAAWVRYSSLERPTSTWLPEARARAKAVEKRP
jgi:hypothetical protein